MRSLFKQKKQIAQQLSEIRNVVGRSAIFFVSHERIQSIISRANQGVVAWCVPNFVVTPTP